MAGFFGMERLNSRTVSEPANLLERVRQTRRIARELHRRGIGQTLALATDGRLDQSPEEHACPADDDQGQTNQRQRILASPRPDQNSTDNRQAKDAKNQSH